MQGNARLRYIKHKTYVIDWNIVKAKVIARHKRKCTSVARLPARVSQG